MNSFASSRRSMLRAGARLALAAVALPLARPAAAEAPDAAAPDALARRLAFDHTHTGEQLALTYAVGPRYLPAALGDLNHFLRDHYSGEVGNMDPQLFDLLHTLRHTLGCSAPFQVISAYRCPATNDRLRTSRDGGVARRSLHMDGKAMDVRIEGVALADLRDAALSLQLGGVGYYPREQFVHVDTGRVRSWAG
ncbi:YcbK family protein [Azoarcus olearius]|uniref:YcbK family protein n=1 Tax=Azoarcus sp. (strain BH72) TaxID=418699 RepID=UPI0012EE61F7|nr:DUF882 domain-containing protein [Azoarcus olearius]